jgi:hypothetical protein
MFRFPADMAPRQGEPNRLNEQTLVHDFERTGAMSSAKSSGHPQVRLPERLLQEADGPPPLPDRRRGYRAGRL